MFNIVIVEDEKPILDLMKFVIGQNPHYKILGAFTNPLEALERMQELRPDVAFLDVEMPKMNGLELAQKMNETLEDTRIVFTTAYTHYALDAFKVYAFDYILKPVTPAAIERITNRLVKQYGSIAVVDQKRQQVSVKCFGGFEVRNPEGAQVRWPTRKTEELFAYFLCNPEQDVSKWQLADLFWPDMDEERASHNLHNTIYRLKKMLKEHDIGMDILKTNEGYMLDVSNQTYDVLEFLRIDCSLAEEIHGDKAEYLCSLYKGPLFDKKDYLWKIPLEESFGKWYTSLMFNLVQQDIAEKEWKKAERKLDLYLSLYPLHEGMNQALIDLYANNGSKEQAANHYLRFETIYRQEVGMELPEEMRARLVSYLG